MNRVQGIANKKKQRINELKKIEKRTGKDMSEMINRLEESRLNTLKSYVER